MYKSKIFREYDIRGVVGIDYDTSFASLLGKALLSFLKESFPEKKSFKISVGRDARPSGNDLFRAFSEALISEQVTVLDLQIVPTPLVYFSSFYCETDASVSITGSHNPSEYNGFKICIGKSTLHGSEIQHLLSICKKIESSLSLPFKKIGSVEKTDVVTPYLSDVVKRVPLKKKLKVVLDSGNGTASEVAPKLFEKLGCDVIPLFCELDGSFPNHHPDPTVVENLKDLQTAVLKHKADVGIAYDGDADRIGAVDEKGNILFGDELLILFSREILKRKPGATILSEVKSSFRLYEDIRKNGGRPIMWKTGHSLIKAKMKEEKAELAGEMSGHIFFSDRYYGYDDAIYSSARLAEILTNESRPLSALLSDLPKTYFTPEIRFDCDDEKKFKLVDLVKKRLNNGKYKIIDIDGVRFETDSGWGLLRASNTQPVLVMRFEATSESHLNSLKSELEKCLKDAEKDFK